MIESDKITQIYNILMGSKSKTPRAPKDKLIKAMNVMRIINDYISNELILELDIEEYEYDESEYESEIDLVNKPTQTETLNLINVSDSKKNTETLDLINVSDSKKDTNEILDLTEEKAADKFRNFCLKEVNSNSNHGFIYELPEEPINIYQSIPAIDSTSDMIKFIKNNEHMHLKKIKEENDKECKAVKKHLAESTEVTKNVRNLTELVTSESDNEIKKYWENIEETIY